MAETVNNKKVSKFSKIAKFFKQLRLELKKVVWPTRQQLISSTISVIVFCLVIGALITVLDLTIGELIIKKLLKLG